MSPASTASRAPRAYRAFVRRFPKLAKAWDLIGEAGGEGPLDESTARLVKLGIAIGAMREGAVHSSVRKARAAGLPREALRQIVALAAGTLGLPSTVAVHTWVEETLARLPAPRGKSGRRSSTSPHSPRRRRR